MNKTSSLILLATFSLSLSACTQQIFGNKTARPIPLKPLKAIAAKNANIAPKTAWQIKTGSAMRENKIHPYIDNRAVYIAGGTSASAWQKTNGKLIWKANIGETISAGINGSADNKQQIFLGTNNGNAISLDANTGKIQWIERLSSEILSVSPGKDGRVAFRTIDGKLNGLSATTGELIWQQSQKTPALTLKGASVPVIVSSYVISGFDNGKVAAYQLQSGQPVWEVTLALPRGRTELERMIDIDGKIKPIGNALFAASLNGSASGINMKDGGLAWSRRFSSSTGVMVDAHGLYSSDNKGNVWKLNPQTGDPLWKMDDLQRYEPTLPALVGSSQLIIGDKKGNLHWVNTTTGQFTARSKGDPAGYSVEPEVEGNTVYAIGKSGILSKLFIQ